MKTDLSKRTILSEDSNCRKKPDLDRREHIKRPLMYKKDIFFILALLLIIGLLFYVSLSRPTDHLKAIIYYENVIIDEIDLTKATPRTFSYPQNPDVVFEIFPNHQIAFVASNCPDQVCVHMGHLARSGDYAACLPNGFVVRIIRDFETDSHPKTNEADIIQ